MNSGKPSEGRWIKRDGDEVVRGEDGYFIADAACKHRPFYEQEANAALIAEAGTVLHEFGKTPRQLAEECARLRDAMRKARKELLRCNPGNASIARGFLENALAEAEQGGNHAGGGGA